MKRGWIKLNRGLTDHWLWKKSRPFSPALAWIDIILRCNHARARLKTKTGFVQIERGQFHTSERSLAADWGWDKKRVRRFLQSLESDGMIQKVVRNSTTGRTTEGTTVTVLNYGLYQDSGGTDAPTSVPTDASTREPLTPPKQESKALIRKSSLVEAVHLRLAELLRNRILAWMPKIKFKGTVDAWANTIRLAMECDGRTEEELGSVIIWATADPFWQTNILSASGLRKHFDQIQAKMKTSKTLPEKGRDYSGVRK